MDIEDDVLEHPGKLLTEEDAASPELQYWTRAREEQWVTKVSDCMKQYNLRRSGERRLCCKRLDSYFRREVRAALNAGSYWGAMECCCRLMDLLQDEDLLFPGYYTVFDSKIETPAALRDGFTLAAMELRCLEQAEEILRTAPEASQNRLWKLAVWICGDAPAEDRFRCMLLNFPWPEERKALIQSLVTRMDRKYYEGEPGTECEPYDLEPYRPPFPDLGDPAELKLGQTPWEERIQARYRAEYRRWLDWLKRRGWMADYQYGLLYMAEWSLLATPEDMRELRRVFTEREWADAMKRIRRNPYWKARWAEVKQIQREVPDCASEEPQP